MHIENFKPIECQSFQPICKLQIGFWAKHKFKQVLRKLEIEEGFWSKLKFRTGFEPIIQIEFLDILKVESAFWVNNSIMDCSKNSNRDLN